MLHHILFHLRAKNDALMFTQKYSKPRPKQIHIMWKWIIPIILEYIYSTRFIYNYRYIGMSIHQKCKNMPTNNKPREDAIRCWYFVCWGFSAEHEKLVSLQLLHITNHYVVQLYLILVCVYCLLRSLKIHHGIPYSCIGAKSETSIGRQPKKISWKPDLSIFMTERYYQ